MIRWITETLGTAPFTSVTESSGQSVIDVRDLVDKHGNTAEAVLEKINQALQALNSGKRVVVCCDYGISRSNAIATGVLCRLEGISLNQAITKVTAATGEKNIKIDMLRIVRQALDDKPANSREMNRQRSLLTGGAGFIGQQLGTRLNNVFTPASKCVDLLTDPVALDAYINEHDIDCIVHLANPRIYTSNQACGEIVVMMQNILDVCRIYQLKLYYLSCWEVFSGYHSEMTLANESLPTQANGPYSNGKVFAETLLQQYGEKYNLPYCLIRSGAVYGPGAKRPRFIYNFIDKALKGEDIYTHRYLNGFPALDLLHCEDLATALELLITNNAEGIYHVGGNGLHSTQEIASMLIELSSSNSSLYHNDIDDYCANIQLDTARIEREYGWQPDIDLHTGLKSLLRPLDR